MDDQRINNLENHLTSIASGLHELAIEQRGVVTEIKNMTIQQNNHFAYLRESLKELSDEVSLQENTIRLQEAEIIRMSSDIGNLKTDVKELKDESKSKVKWIATIVGGIITTVVAGVMVAKFL